MPCILLAVITTHLTILSSFAFKTVSAKTKRSLSLTENDKHLVLIIFFSVHIYPCFVLCFL